MNKKIPIIAVLNNDVIGGIICGETTSPPSCPDLNHVDSTQVRLFSAGLNNSPHKQLARFNKLEYEEELADLMPVPMTLTIMSGEDRAGRGGDHIPFRQQGFAAMRFCPANEHGNANVNDPDYSDLQRREIARLPAELRPGPREILYRHGYNFTGTYAYSLVVDGMVMDTKQMIFTN